MTSELKINKPKPIIVPNNAVSFSRVSEINPAIRTLLSGDYIVITEFFSDGTSLLNNIHKYLRRNLLNKTFKEQQEYREAYHKLSNLVLLEVVDQDLIVKKSPGIGWLKKLYPENDHFCLTMPQIQGLNSSWQWYKNGVSIPVLRNRLHPYYGTYFPTRFNHLILFDNWLKKYKGTKKTAIDVGVGCGVLSLQMVQHGFQKVFTTDTNPNAILGLKESMGTTKISRKIELDFGHLFGKWEKQTELIVFNPPWLPEQKKSKNLDQAIYYNESLFSEFFMEAKKRLLPEGRIVLIFSNLAQITNVTKSHPIEDEIANGNRFQIEHCFKKKAAAASIETKRDQHWREMEEVQLWVLTHI